MSAVLEARAVITAEDRTGKAFDSLKARIAAITKQTEVLDRAMGAVGAVAKNVEGFKPLPGSAVSDMSKLAETVTRVDKAMLDVNRSAIAVTGSVGKTSAEVVGLSARLMDAGAKLKGINDFKDTAKGLKEAGFLAQKAQQDARLLAAKVDATPTPTKSLQAAHGAALAEVRQTERALALQNERALAAQKSLAQLGVPLNQLRTEEERLKSVVLGTNDALLRQIQIEREGAAAAEKAAAAQRLSAEQEQRHHKQMLSRMAAEDQARLHAGAGHAGGHDHGFVNYALTSAAMAVSAHEIGHVIAEGWHEGADLQHERMQLKNAGRTPEEMAEIEAAGRRTISTLPTANFTETMKVIAETTSAFGSVHHAIENLPFMMKAMSVLKSAGGDKIQGDAGTVGRYFAKFFEERQTRPEDFQKEASAMIPAMVASGGVFNPEQLYAFGQQAKSALPNYDMHFLSRIVPSIVTTLGGERAGTAANAFNSIIMGKANDKKQAEAWERFGLLDDSKVIKKGGAVVSWTAGAVKDTNLALQDPLKWAETVALPAMIAKGIKTEDRLELAKVLGTMFRNQNGNLFANEMMQAASRILLHKDDEQIYGKAGTLDQIYDNDLGEFNVAAGALGEALKTLGSATTGPMMHRAATALSWLAGELNQVSAFGFRHPTIAATAGVGTAAAALAGAGWIGKLLFNGFGLKGSAAALTGSAGAIDAAAARLGAAGGLHGGPGGTVGRAAGAAETAAEGAGSGALVGKVVGGGPGVAGAPIYEAPTIALPGAATLGAAILGGVVAAGVVETVKKSFEAQEPGKGGLYSEATDATRSGDEQDLAAWKAEREDLASKVARQRAMEKTPGGSDVATYNDQRLIEQLDAAIANRERSLADLDAANVNEARVGRALMTLPMPRPSEAFGPDLPPGWSREQFGPYQPNTNDDDRLSRSRASDAAGLSGSGRIFDGNALRHDDSFGDGARTRPGDPVPVTITNAPPLFHDVASHSDDDRLSRARASDAPPPFHDGWLDGERPSIEEKSRRGAAMFRQDPEAARGDAMSEHFGPASDIHATVEGPITAEVSGEAQVNVVVTVNPSGELLTAVAAAKSAPMKLSSTGSSGSVGTSYPQTAPTGRMGPR